MSDTTKRVVFEGVDMVSGALKSMTKNEREFFQTSLDLGTKFSQTSSGVLKFINQEIEGRKQLLEITKKQKIANAESYYESEKKGRKGAVLDEIEATKRGKISGIESSTKKEQEQLDSLKKINETLVIGFQRTIAEDKDQAKKWFETVSKKPGRFDALTPEDKLKFKVYQEYFGGGKDKDEKSKSNFWPTLWGTLGGNVLARTFDKLGGIASATTGQHAVAQALGSIPIAGSFLGSVYGRHYDALENAQAGRMRYRSIVGRGQGVGGVGYGMTGGEVGMLGAELALQRGSGADLGGRLTDQMALERAYGLDRGMLFKLSKGERFGGGSAMSGVTGLIKDVGKEIFKGGDFSRLPELIEFQTQVQEQQLDALGRIDSKSTRGVMGAFMELGGKYAMSSKYQQGIQGALTGPSNEWQRARQLSVLSKLDPSASRWKLMEMMEGGLYTPGYMGGVMGAIRQTAGSGEAGMELLYGMLGSKGWNRRDVRNLYQKWQENPALFDKLGSEDQLKDILGIRGRGKKMTPYTAVNAAAVETAYESSPWKGFGEIFGQSVGEFSKAISELVGVLKSLFGGGDSKPDKDMAEKIRIARETLAKYQALKRHK